MILIWIISVSSIFSKNKNKIKEELEIEKYKNSLICRFVLDGLGRKIGESVAFNNDLLIIKSGKKYLGVPIKHIEEDGKTLLVKGLIEQDKAELMGEKWRRESFKEINNYEDEKNGL
jgi:hypothetical protein